MGTCDERSIVNSAGACKASRVPDEGGTLHLASLSFDREWQALSDREGRLLPAPKQPKYCVHPRDNGNTALVFPALSRSLRNVGCRVFRPASVAYDSRPRIRQLFVSLPNAPAVNMFSPTPHLLALSPSLTISLALVPFVCRSLGNAFAKRGYPFDAFCEGHIGVHVSGRWSPL